MHSLNEHYLLECVSAQAVDLHATANKFMPQHRLTQWGHSSVGERSRGGAHKKVITFLGPPEQR